MPILQSREFVLDPSTQDTPNVSDTTNTGNELAARNTGGIIVAAIVFGGLLLLALAFGIRHRYFRRRSEGGSDHEESGDGRANDRSIRPQGPRVEGTAQVIEMLHIAASTPMHPRSRPTQDARASIDIGDSQQTQSSKQNNFPYERNWPLRASVERAVAHNGLTVPSALSSETTTAFQAKDEQRP